MGVFDPKELRGENACETLDEQSSARRSPAPRPCPPRFRRRPALRDLPVVVLTTRAGDKHVSLARRLGVRHYVTKPVDEQSFVRLVESLVAGPAVEATA